MATGYTSQTCFTDLNEHCILEIALHLSFKDKLSLVSVFGGLGYLCPDMDVTILNVCFGISESKRILSRCGPYVKKLNHISNAPLSEPFYEIMHEVIKSCPNVQELDITLISSYNYPGTEVSHKFFYYFQKLIAPLTQLKLLRLDDCGLSDKNCEIISTLSLLESLDLSFNPMITGKYLSELKKLTFFNLTQCVKIESEHFVEICASNKFKTLIIIGCNELNDAAIAALLETQTNLEIVLASLIENVDITQICQLRSLKIIQIVGSGYFKSLTKSIQYEEEFLESLNFMANDDDNEVLELIFEKIEEIRNLKNVNLTEVQNFSEYLEDFAVKRRQGIGPRVPNFEREYASIPNSDCPDDYRFSDNEAIFGGIFVGVTEKNEPLQINEVEILSRSLWENEVYKHFFKYIVTLSFDDSCTYKYYHNDFLSTYVYNCEDYIVIMKKIVNLQDLEANVVRYPILYATGRELWEQSVLAYGLYKFIKRQHLVY